MVGLHSAVQYEGNVYIWYGKCLPCLHPVREVSLTQLFLTLSTPACHLHCPHCEQRFQLWVILQVSVVAVLLELDEVGAGLKIRQIEGVA